MIKDAFNKYKSIFIPFLMSGYPTLDISTKAVIALANSGADVIELGVPFSDPTADGPTNQYASKKGIENGVNLRMVIDQIKDIRKAGCNVPIIIFSYLNPILSLGYEEFCQKAKSAGANGLLVVDLPPEEGDELYSLAKNIGLEIILLASPTTDTHRLQSYIKYDPSFIYYISRLSVTGVQQKLSNSLEEEVSMLRNHLPEHMKIAVGFGISSVEQASKVSEIADGVIMGSKLVTMLGNDGLVKLGSFTKELVSVIHENK